MARFCTNCGHEIADNEAFCTECGTPVPAAETVSPEAAAPAPQPAPQPAPAPQPVPVPQPAPVPQPVFAPQPEKVKKQAAQPEKKEAPAPAPEVRSKELKTGAYFWLILLYALPIVGWFFMILFSFVPKNKNLKNFSRAHLIWFIIGLVIVLLLALGLKLLIQKIDPSGAALDAITNGDFSSIIDYFAGII